MAEINRIISHLYWLSIFGIFTGHSTMLMWSFADRELFIDLNQMIGGQRLTYSHFVPGGVRRDIPDNFGSLANNTFDFFEKRLVEYDNIYLNNPVYVKRTKGVGILKKEDAIDLGIVGPNLRGSGVRSDVRKDEPYSVYDELDFKIPVFESGDSYSRIKVRIEEMEQSMNIVRQALDKIPKGPIRRKPLGVIPKGESFVRTEAARGEIGYYIVGDGKTSKPYRLRCTSPSFRNLIAIPHVMKGSHLADMPVIYWSFDYWPVEADR